MTLSASDELRIAISPDVTFTALIAERASASLWQMIARMALGNAVLVLMMPMLVTGRITVGLLVVSALSWSFVVLVQLLLGVALARSTPSRPVTAVRALELWFSTHIPFSLFLLFVGAVMFVTQHLAPLWTSATAIVPAVWTACLNASYCRVVLGLPPVRARKRVAIEQVVAWAVVGAYVLLAVGGISALMGYVARQVGAAG